MARFEPTASQKCAIEETGRAVLVSAAAGSGKTRVLTERLLRRIEHDADIDSFLVITFTKAAAAELERRLNAQRLQLLRETPGSICVIDRFDDPVAMREFVNAGMLLAGGVCAAFTGCDAEGYRYIIGSRTVDLRAEAKAINAAISGRGGGKPTMIQGSCTAPAAVIEAFFAAYPGK